MWQVEWHNDTGPDDDYYEEWWTVTDGKRTFRCDDNADAAWLQELLNSHAAS